MDELIFATAKEFEKNYLNIYLDNYRSKISLLDFLTECKKLYEDPKNFNPKIEKILTEIDRISDKYPEDKFFDNSDYYSEYLFDYSKFNDFHYDYKDKLIYMDNDQLNDLKKYFSLKKYYILLLSDFDDRVNDILSFINNEIIKIEIVGSDKRQIEAGELKINQVKKVGLLIRSGIVKFLQDENPGITTNQIATFFEELTKVPLKASSINPHLGIDNSKYAIKNDLDKNDLDFILKKFHIKPNN